MKRYQIFVSSTYMDLQSERAAVAQNALELNHIPVGMEYFGAADEQQMDLIKREIDNSDYYLLIISGKYGSVEANSGKSYTHLEYEYAESKGKPILVFVREGWESLPKEERETDGVRLTKLQEFIAQAAGSKRIRASWKDMHDLVNKTGNALTKEINRTSDRTVGWVRADQVTDEMANAEIIKLKNTITQLESKEKEFVHLTNVDETDSTALTEAVSQIVLLLTSSAPSQSQGQHIALLRSTAIKHLEKLIELWSMKPVPPNSFFNAHVDASRLQLHELAQRLVTIAEYIQNVPSHTMAKLHKQVQTGSAFEVVDDNGAKQVVLQAETPQKVLADAQRIALNMAADAAVAQCEIVYSQTWNMSTELRELNGIEKMVAVLAKSRSARDGTDVPDWLPLPVEQVTEVSEIDWEAQAGRTVPSYLVEKMAACAAVLSFKGWRDVYQDLVIVGLKIHKEESPMTTWAKSFRRNLVETSIRCEMIEFLSDVIQQEFGLGVKEFVANIES